MKEKKKETTKKEEETMKEEDGKKKVGGREGWGGFEIWEKGGLAKNKLNFKSILRFGLV